MLKIALIDEERRGAALMKLWSGKSAPLVFGWEGDALLMERATGKRALAAMSTSGEDDEATHIICSVVNRIHEPVSTKLGNLMPLRRWFEALDHAAAAEGGVFSVCAGTAADLLARQAAADIVPLHGDIHHGNILDFGEGGWRVIDPKGLIGDRAFDFANLFCNPDETAADPGRFDRRVAIVCEEAGLERTRLLRWVLAWAGLSAAFSLEDQESPASALKIARLAAVRLAA